MGFRRAEVGLGLSSGLMSPLGDSPPSGADVHSPLIYLFKTFWPKVLLIQKILVPNFIGEVPSELLIEGTLRAHNQNY